MDNIHTLFYEVVKRGVVKVLSTEGANGLLDQNMQKLTKLQEIKQDLVRHLIKSSALTVPRACLIDQQAERAVASVSKFRQENIRDETVTEEVTPPSTLTGRSLKS